MFEIKFNILTNKLKIILMVKKKKLNKSNY